MGMESYKDEIGGGAELLEAKVKNAQQSVEQGEIELAAADENKKDIWQNRIDQRRQELESLQRELENMSNGV